MEDERQKPDGTLTSKALAALIVDGLIRARIIDNEAADRAIEVAAEEMCAFDQPHLQFDRRPGQDTSV